MPTLSSAQALPLKVVPLGDEMQIDFGFDEVLIAVIKTRVCVFVAVLSYSRRVFAKLYPMENQATCLNGIDLDVVEKAVGHSAHVLRADLHAVLLLQEGPEVSRAHAAGLHGDDLLVEAAEVAGVLGQQDRLETTLAVSRDADLQINGVRSYCLAAGSVALVALLAGANRLVEILIQVNVIGVLLLKGDTVPDEPALHLEAPILRTACRPST